MTATTVKELREVCERIEREFGPDCKVRIQLRDEDGRLIDSGHCRVVTNNHKGTLYLSNRPKMGE